MTDSRPRTRVGWLRRLGRRRIVLMAGLVLAAGLLTGGALLVADAYAARDHLVAAQEHVAEVRRAIGAGDTDAARTAVGAATEEVTAARTRTDGPLWWLARRVPVAGRAPTILVEVVGVAEAATRLADRAVGEGGSLLADGGTLEVQIDDGRLDLSALDDARDVLDRLPVEALRAAREELAATADTWVPVFVRDGRRDALELAADTLDLAGDARRLTATLPGLLGQDGRRRYLLAVQTSAELRATGGVIGFLSVLTVDRGRFSLAPPVVHEAIDEADRATVPVGPDDPLASGFRSDWRDPVPTSEDFARRYGHAAAAALLSNVNVDPHLPVTGDVLVRLYEQRTGDQVDGAILLDPVGLEEILRAIGPVPIAPDARVHPEIPAAIPADEVAEWVTRRVYELVGAGQSGARERFLRAFGTAAFDTVFAGDWDGLAVSRAVGRAAAGRHLQVYSQDGDERARLEALGVGGRLAAGADGADLLAVTANNAVGGKQDVWVGHRFAGTLRLRVTGDAAGDGLRADRSGTLRTTLVNPLPASGVDEYIIGNCLVDQDVNQCFDGPPGVNRTWFSVWMPAGSTAAAVRDADGPRGARVDQIHGHRVVDHFLETPPESEAWFEVDLAGPVALRRDGPDLVYELTWWRQAKAVPDVLDLEVAAPDGWGVAAAELHGGGDGRGMGALGDAGPLRVDIDGNRVRIRGAATRDAHLTIRFSRSLWSRLTTWLGEPL